MPVMSCTEPPQGIWPNEYMYFAAYYGDIGEVRSSHFRAAERFSISASEVSAAREVDANMKAKLYEASYTSLLRANSFYAWAESFATIVVEESGITIKAQSWAKGVSGYQSSNV